MTVKNHGQLLGEAHVFAVDANELCVDWHATLAGVAPERHPLTWDR